MMDNLRGFDSLNPAEEAEAPDYAQYSEDQEDVAIEAPPVVSGDERRMQVRAYNFWTSQLGEKNYPPVEELNPEDVDDFRDYSVLLDFTSGIENPSIPYLGDELRQACELGEDISYLDQVPPRSLLSRITDHYLQIIANRAPIGFEAEFVNDNNVTIMYRGILLPYSSDDDTIDFIYGVINWKEVAAADVTSELQAEVEQALESQPQPREHVPAWADSPTGATLDAPVSVPDEVSELALGEEFVVGTDEPSEDSSLADWLNAARNSADDAREADHRSRDTLYSAIGRAWDFALIAEKNADDFAELLTDSGITAQERAPMTPIVKLVFGANYDKTRLTEFAAALNFAQRNAVPMGGLAELIGKQDGGLKAIVKAERRARKVARGEHVAVSSADPRPRLRDAKLRDLSEFAGPGDEFVVLVARRGSDGSLALVGSVAGDAAFTEKALSKTVV
mgnify:CR=1 FL=1